jgi:hypothetical protein
MTTKALNNGAVAVKKSALPAVQETESKAFKAFNKFVETLDELVEYHDDLKQIATELDVAHHLDPDDIPSADRFKRDKEWLQDDLNRCREAFRRFDQDGASDERYDDEGNITFQSVSVRLGALVGSFANAKPGSPEVFGRMLAHHVLAIEPTVCELESACRALVERDKPFFPEITEIMAALRSEKPKWLRRRYAFKQVDELRRKIITAIPKAKAIAEEAAKEKAAQKWVAAKEQAEHVVAYRLKLNDEARFAGVDACSEYWRQRRGLRAALCEESGRYRHQHELLVSFVLGCYSYACERRRNGFHLFACPDIVREWEQKQADARRLRMEAALRARGAALPNTNEDDALAARLGS